ncbi:MAG: hypothetical protein KJ063_06340 [Anaerolineae bacterium]|nr:hypothetical protein [Anaerolineae bacterium]
MERRWGKSAARDELRWLFAHYSRKKLIEWMKFLGWRRLPRRRLLWWQLYFDLPDLPQRNNVWPH